MTVAEEIQKLKKEKDAIILHFRTHVVVCKDDGIFFFLSQQDRSQCEREDDRVLWSRVYGRECEDLKSG